ncbi:high mobility group box domain-containing protein [Zychaea mexicana]|uniref:high mobility group box domain-containing protein n=1 Tax=Zychaea mexicana TaxID=64656 RepID=UPI0022FEB5C0|nr:high mobility group box domain-containing protein [Zychaea mexicana]KAI9496736.1 high mobility group box domain-containing protein [Zychaea mexicana]
MMFYQQERPGHLHLSNQHLDHHNLQSLPSPATNHHHNHHHRHHHHQIDHPNNNASNNNNNVPSPPVETLSADSTSGCSSSSSSGGSKRTTNDMIIQQQTKRKYRRRPKPDKNAPNKPPSAYVMFSNHIRAEMKDQSMGFAEISKTIGEQWKTLSPEKKHFYELTAMQAKDAYLVEMQQYCRTPEYRQYQEYLKNFKEKQAVANRLVSRARRRSSPSKKPDSPSRYIKKVLCFSLIMLPPLPSPPFHIPTAV